MAKKKVRRTKKKRGPKKKEKLIVEKRVKGKKKLKIKRVGLTVGKKVRLIVSGVIISVLLGLFYFFILRDLPLPTKLTTREIPLTTKILDRKGKLLYRIYTGENRIIVPINKIPKHLIEATIAVEDKDFYKHGGINFFGGIVRAVKETILHQNLQGGSTITQQLIKSALLTPERTVRRKVREAIVAMLTEIVYSKDQILEMYLNQVPYGGTAWGIEAATETYFDKHVEDLTLAESALLAGLPAAPTYYSPFGVDPQRAIRRQHQVLRRMYEDKRITKEEMEAAKKEEVELTEPKNNIKAPHFVMYIKELLVNEYGEKMVEQGGLTVKTTLDLDLQEYAQATVSGLVSDMADYRVGNGAAMVTKPATGEILAMVGSVDYWATGSGKVNVALAKRSPGSSIKPLNYALGFLKGKITPATVFADAPICFKGVPKTYCPRNYDGSFHGAVPVRVALGSSYNIPAVKVLKLNGIEDFISTASAMGLTTLKLKDKSRYGLSLTLGGCEVRMIDMATAFGVFANTGIRRDLTPFLKVTDRHGNVWKEYKEKDRDISSPLKIRGERVLPPEVTFLVSHILLDNGARTPAFGSRSPLVVANHPEVSVKTGTSEDKTDNWTIGYTQNFLVAVWVGNNDSTPMSPYLESGGTGAAPIWNAIMSHVLEGEKGIWLKRPDNITGMHVCGFSGYLPSEESECDSRFEYFIKDHLPGGGGKIKREVWIDKETDNLPKEGVPEDRLEMKEEVIINDPVSGEYCVTCASRDAERKKAEKEKEKQGQ